MTILIYLGVIAVIFFVQMLNGYALCETKLYTPVFTYCLISGIMAICIVGAIVWWFIK